MTLKNIWSLIIKFGGLYSLWLIILSIPNYINVAFIPTDPSNKFASFGPLLAIYIQPVVLLIVAFVALFRTDACIAKLRLVTESDQDNLNLNIHRSQAIKIVVIILGAYFLLDGIPYFFADLSQFLQSTNGDAFYKDRTFAWLFGAAMKVIVGYSMIAYNNWFTNYIELKRRKV